MLNSIYFIIKLTLLSLFMLLFSCDEKENDKLFSLLPSNQTGIKFKNTIKETDAFNVLEYGYLYNGGGISIGDVNNDGLADIYFTGNLVASFWDSTFFIF